MTSPKDWSGGVTGLAVDPFFLLHVTTIAHIATDAIA
jgi:hypothetical protein